MTALELLQKMIRKLSPQELAELRAWLAEQEGKRPDDRD